MISYSSIKQIGVELYIYIASIPCVRYVVINSYLRDTNEIIKKYKLVHFASTKKPQKPHSQCD